MNAIIKSYFERLRKRFREVKIYNGNNNTVEDVGYYIVNESSKVHTVFYSKKMLVKKCLTYEQLKHELINSSGFMMISIATNECKKEIYSVLGAVSKYNGISAPFIEIQNNIIYFPKLRYSDLGLIKHLCELNNMKEYRLLLASGC